MRIQHNIMAMNAYRNYNTNTSALSKNLEKLSSGYKINRAGDDAAGLAISEKMRAQITGLEAAQKNVKDGISLVKTAEGAMQEIQDMLNRMDYLATQSANGTYDNEVDRANLQKEVDQLKSEIDRIADSANFNGIKLLDGSLDTNTQVKSTAGDFEIGGTAGKSGTLPTVGDTMGTNTVLHKGAANDTSVNAFGMEFHDLSIKGDVGDTFTITIGGTTLTGTIAADASTTALTGEDVAKALAGTETSKITFTDANGDDYDATEFTINGGKFKAELSSTGRGVTFTQTDDAELTGDKVAMDVTIAAGDDAPGGTAPTVGTPVNGSDAVTAGFTAGDKVAGTPVSKTAGDMSGTTLTNVTALQAIDDLNVGGVIVDLSANAGIQALSNGDDVADVLAAIQSAVVTAVTAANNTAGGNTANYNKIENIKVEADSNTGFKVSFDSTPQTYHAAENAKGASVEVDFTGKTGEDVIGSTVTVGDKTYEFVKTGGTAAQGNIAVAVADDADANDLGGALVTAATGTGAATGVDTPTNTTGVVKFETTATGADQKIKAEGKSTATAVTVTGDFNIKTTDQSVKADAASNRLASTSFALTQEMATSGSTIRIGDDTYTFTDDAKATGTGNVYIGDLVDKDGKVATADLAAVAQRLTDAAANNTTYSVSQKGGTIQVVEQVGYTTGSQKYDLSTEEGIEASLGFSIASSKTGNGKALTLQIGDTSDTYNQLKVSVGDMHTAALSIANLDISSSESASAAIQTIKDAINQVSSVRGDLGATQNRLEHTANNLSVMAENIQDAESTIRDTDVAEEMMAYTKNNILIQSAQAMLAQANAVPQGVLQLLG